MEKVILVDDERMVAESIEKVVDWSACGVQLAGVYLNGFDALEAIRSLHPDIVITDIKMPVMSGLELIRQVREFDTHVEFIILSGYGEFELAKEAMKEGVKQFLLKPCSETEISEAVNSAKKELSMRQRDSFYRTLGENWMKREGDKPNGEDDEAGVALPDGMADSQDFIDTILEYVRVHFYEENLNLKWIAREVVFLNEDYVSKQFRQRVGSKFTQYMNMVRMEAAKQRLLSSDASSEEIAVEVGFGNNPKYFAKVFKKYAGCTPTEYKNNNKQ